MASRSLILLFVLVSGCKTEAPPCMSMGMASDLVSRSKLLRLDVYDAGIACDGYSVTAGSPPPAQSKVVAAGQPIKLDIPAGKHALVLTAFADDAATQPIGAACTETDLTADVGRCFMLTLIEIPDLAEPVDLSVPTCDGGPCTCTQTPDSCPVGSYCALDGNCAGGCKATADCVAIGGPAKLCDVPTHRCVECLAPSDCELGKRCSPSGACVDGCDIPAGSLCQGALACCSNQCINTQTELSSCGSCGRVCNSTSVTTPACAGGLCTSACVAGRGNCNKPIAPAADDGCETNFYDVTHCGGCTTVCTLPNATPTCPAGTCQVQSCTATHYNCDGMPANGCECTGVDLIDGVNPAGCCPAGACQKLHNDGFTHTFYDCTALGTFNKALAQRAALAYNLAGATDNLEVPNETFCVRRRVGMSTQECVCWNYAGAAPGRAKHVNADCSTPSAADQPWQ